jgi:hypothetical protein
VKVRTGDNFFFGTLVKFEKHVKMQEVFSFSSYAEALSTASLSIRICLNTWMERLKVKYASFEMPESKECII